MTDPTDPHGDKFHQDTNEIEDFASRIKVGWARWGNLLTIGFGLGMLAFVAFGPMEWFGRKNLLESYRDKNHEEIYRELSSDSPEVLAAQSLTCKDPKVAALMALRGADLFLKKAQIQEKDEDAKKALAGAEKLYKQVADAPAADGMVKANALLGLASVAESKGSWAEAEAAYDRVIKTPDVLANLAQLAQLRKDKIAALRQPVVFGPEPVKAPEPKAPATPAAPAAVEPEGPTAPLK